jgi:hypothetical protein
MMNLLMFYVASMFQRKKSRSTQKFRREFEASLQKMMAGDMTLVSELGSMRLAIQVHTYSVLIGQRRLNSRMRGF